jgi:hypothetical protein
VAEVGIRRGVLWGVAGWLVTLALAVIVLELRRSPPREELPESAPAEITTAPLVDAESAETSRRPWSQSAKGREPVPYIENLVWGEIDLREAQAVMPDNMYWEHGAPTSDPAVLEAREQEEKRRNEEYGKVLSGDANEAEVLAYYDYREHLSKDYLEFAEWMRNRYGDGISEQFRGLLDLSIKLHTARLAQIPLDRDEALERSRTRARIREEWQREQAEFADESPTG